MMQLTDEQLAELERRGWKLTDRCGEIEVYEREDANDYCDLRFRKTGVLVSGKLEWAAEAAGALGIQPDGYRLVPEAIAERAVPFLGMMADAVAEGQVKYVSKEVRQAFMALASALAAKDETFRKLLEGSELHSRLQQNGGEGL